MKKTISLLTALALSVIPASGALAEVISASDQRTPATTLTNNDTKVDMANGVIDEENGTVLSVSKESPEEYLFKCGDYTYSLLDKDANGNYFILSADRYGRFSLDSTAVNNIFDPTPGETNAAYADDLNLAVYLNTDFLNGTQTRGSMTAYNSKTEIDSAVKDYIVVHDWYTEGNGQDADEVKHLTAVTKNDYSVSCKIALLSWKEYIKYSNKIGYASVQYAGNNLTASTTSVLRTPNSSSTGLYCFSEKTGSISGSFNVTTTKAPQSYFLRPCFYVSREYFKNTHLTSYGSDVKRMLKEDFTEEELRNAGYSEEETADIKGTAGPALKSGFIMTDDMENGIDNWVQKALLTDAVPAEAVAYPEESTTNKAMSIGYSTYAYLKLNEAAETGILTVDADVTVNGGNFGIGIVESGYQNMQGKLYPVFIGNGLTRLSAIINRDASKYDVSDASVASYYVDDADAKMSISNNVQAHIKLIIDALSGKCAVMAGDKLSTVIDIPYLGTGKGQNAIGAIAFMNRNSGSAAYVDNVKISYDPLGSVIFAAASGGNKIMLELRASVDTALTAEDIVLQSYLGETLPVTAVRTMDNGSLLLETSAELADGGTYRLSVPSLGAEYPVTETQLTYTKGGFSAETEITAEKYAQGETAAAVCRINASDFGERKVMFYIASYKEDYLIDVNAKEINITENDFGEITQTLELPLTGEADCIKAFIWNENQIPYNYHAEKTKTN